MTRPCNMPISSPAVLCSGSGCRRTHFQGNRRSSCNSGHHPSADAQPPPTHNRSQCDLRTGQLRRDVAAVTDVPVAHTHDTNAQGNSPLSPIAQAETTRACRWSRHTSQHGARGTWTPARTSPAPPSSSLCVTLSRDPSRWAGARHLLQSDQARHEPGASLKARQTGRLLSTLYCTSRRAARAGSGATEQGKIARVTVLPMLAFMLGGVPTPWVWHRRELSLRAV